MSTWYEEGVFYHMYPLGMTGAPLKQESAEVVHRLKELDRWVPHVQRLGCNAIYIGPLFESSSHGYDTKDYRMVDRRLGDQEDFRYFVEQCHLAGIKVVVDGVFNHTGREFFAFKDLQERGSASSYQGWYRNVNFGMGSPMGDSFSYEAWQGHGELPCLNLQNPEVRQYLFDVVRFWISEFGIDGIRLDCANVMDFSFMEELRRETASMKPDFWLMGEVIHGDYSRWVNERTLHSVTNYELHKSLYSGLNDHNFFEIAHNVDRLKSLGGSLYTFLDNHDENRIASKLTDKNHLGIAWTLLLTLPGIPSLYYGSEWALEGMRTRDSDITLRPAVSPDSFEERASALTKLITELITIHRENKEFHGGVYRQLLLTNRQFAFARLGERTAVVTAVNNDDLGATVAIPAPLASTQAINLVDHSVLPIQDGTIKLTIPGNTGVVLKIRED